MPAGCFNLKQREKKSTRQKLEQVSFLELSSPVEIFKCSVKCVAVSRRKAKTWLFGT